MTIHAGASLPGPFFIAFPIAGPALGIIGIALLPFAFVIWIGINLFIGLGWLALQLGKALWYLGRETSHAAAAVNHEHHAVPSNRPGLTTSDRALLRKLGM